MSKPIFSYFFNDAAQTIAALERLVMTMSIEKNEADAMDDVLEYANKILLFYHKLELESADYHHATQALSLVDTNLAESVVANPATTKVEWLEELYAQLLYVAAALGVIETILPYDAEELNAFLVETNDKGMSLMMLAATVGHAVLNSDAELMDPLLRVLMTYKGESINTFYEWGDVFILTILVHMAWGYMPYASEREQEWILQHYFYYAFVFGVPVKFFLTAVLCDKPRQTFSHLVQKLGNSQEMIPVDTTLAKEMEFAQIVRDYLSALNQNSIPTLAAEKFLASWYGGGVNAEQYRAWLREALSTTYYLQVGNL